MSDDVAESIELCNPEDSSSEKEQNEEKSEKEKDEKLRIDHKIAHFGYIASTLKNTALQEFSNFHHPEICTPPPESLLV